MRKRLLSLGLIMVLCFSLTGCKSSDYKKAVELQNSGDYAGALELFKGIGDDYKDVSDRATECQSFIDSITAFDEAKSLLDDKNAELDKAISEANDLVNGENTALDESLRSLLETKISETKAIKITAPTMAETVKEIDTQTTEMNTTDYSDALKPFMFDPDDNDLDNYCKTEVEESLLNCIMEKEILRRGNKTDLKALKSKIIKSKLETCVKRDFMEYLEHDGENAIETLRKLIYDFLSAENAIIEAKQCNDIVEWTRTVVDRLNPSLRAYPNKQIDLALALILYEQTLRDASYGSVFCKFTEVYKNEGGVF